MVFVKVDKNNCELDIKLQAEFLKTLGIETGNPVNYIVYLKGMPIGITGYYFDEKLPDHVFINWFGVLKSIEAKVTARE